MSLPLTALCLLMGALFGPALEPSKHCDAHGLCSVPMSGERVARAALALVGAPYRMGGENPRTGVDCASLVRLIFRPLGLELPRTAGGQIRLGRAVTPAEISAGDLVFFRDTCHPGVSHVGVAIGSGRFVHAAGRKNGVTVSLLSTKYYRTHFVGARRVTELLRVGGSDSAASSAESDSEPSGDLR